MSRVAFAAQTLLQILIAGIACAYVAYAAPTHAAHEGESLLRIEKQINLIERVVDILIVQRGEVLGVTVVNPVVALKAQKASAEQARVVAVARLAALKKIASTTPAQKTEIATLQNQRIPALTAQIAALVKRIAALSVVVPPKPAVVLPKPVPVTPVPPKVPVPVVTPKSATTTMVTGVPRVDATSQIVITTPSAVMLKSLKDPVRITWKGAEKLDWLTISAIGNTARKAFIVNQKLEPKQQSFDMFVPLEDEYLVTLMSHDGKKPLVGAARIKVAISPITPPKKHELSITSLSVITLTSPVRPVRITWQGSEKLDALKLVITNETTNKVVVNTTVDPSQLAYELASPTPGEYLVQLFGTKNKKPIVFAGSLILRGAPSVVPTCMLTDNRQEYTLGDTATFTWTTQNATKVAFVPDTSGKDNIVPPSGAQKLNGTVEIPMTVLGSPFVILSATGNGKTVTCRQTVTVNPKMTGEMYNLIHFGLTGSNPDASTLEVEKTTVSDGNAVLEFSINSMSYHSEDIAFRMLSIDVETDNPTGVSSVIDRLVLMHNNIEIDGAAIEQGATKSATYMFALNKNLVVTQGDTEIVQVIAYFNPQEGNYPEATTIRASVDVERSPYGGLFTVKGTAIGDTHTLRTGGALLHNNGVDQNYLVNSDATTSDDAGRFTIEFDVTAFEQDVYVPATAVRSTGGGVSYTLVSSSDSTVTTGTAAGTLSSMASKMNGHYVVSEGETETFELVVTYDPIATGSYRLNLNSLNVKSSATGSTQTTVPPEKYNTNLLLIKN